MSGSEMRGDSMSQGMARDAATGAGSSSSVGGKGQQIQQRRIQDERVVGLFSVGRLGRNKTMPVTRAEYEAVPEWKLHCLLSEHGIPAPIKGQLLGGCF